MEEKSIKEQRIRKITQLYYSKPEIQKAIFQFSKDREISPRYFDGFGKRPDTFQYTGDIFELVKRGATSFHCSEELWEDPLKLQTGLPEKTLNEIRKGWDLLIDIDCKWFDYSKLAAKAIIEVLENNGIKNMGIKFSGSKGWHIIVPWKAFPKSIGDTELKDLFPEVPRKIIGYLRFESEKIFRKNLPSTFEEDFKNIDLKKGKKCNSCGEIAKEFELKEFYCNFCNVGEHRKLLPGDKKEFNCPNCRRSFIVNNSFTIYDCPTCKSNSKDNPENFSENIQDDLFELIGLDMILVSPRHLFRMPYSLHEKTALASIVLSKEEIENFQPGDADPMKAQIRDFMPDSKENEALQLVTQSLDWYKEHEPEEESYEQKSFEYQPIKLENLSESMFPPSIQKILEGVRDGRKRAVFVLLNLFRSIGMERNEIEKRLYDWNKKNEIPLPEGYIKSQLSWSYRNKIVPPPNFDKDHYKGIGVVPNEEELRMKNPITFMLKKSGQEKGKKDYKNKGKKKVAKKKTANSNKTKNPKS